LKKKLFNFIRIFISLVLLSFLIYRNRDNFESILNSLKNLDIRFLIIALIIYSAGISCIVFRWGILLKAHGYHIFRPFLWQASFIGWFFNMLLPSSIGGDFYRVYDLHKNKKVPMNENISAVVMDRIIGTISGIILLTITYFLGMFEYISRNAVIIIFSALGGVIVFFMVLFFPRFFRINVILRRFRIFSKIRPKLKEFHDRLISYRYKIKYLLAALFFSLLLQTFFITSYFFVNLSLGLKMKYQMLLFTQPFTALASGVPIAIGGMGIRENALAFAIESFGVSRADATLFSLIMLSIILLNALVGGLIYLFKNVLYKSKGAI
jgi:glycosyltransferase 2 family protein